MTFSEPAEVDCAVCQCPCVAIEMRDGGIVISDAAHRSVGVVLNQAGLGMRVTRVYTEHSITCTNGKRRTM